MTGTWKLHFGKMAAAVVVMIGAGTAHGAEPVRIGWVYAMANAPVLIAEADGHFEAQGLDVALESLTSGPLIREGLNGGTLDMAYMGVPPIVHWVAKGAELVIVAKVNSGQTSLMARRDAGISRVEDDFVQTDETWWRRAWAQGRYEGPVGFDPTRRVASRKYAEPSAARSRSSIGQSAKSGLSRMMGSTKSFAVQVEPLMRVGAVSCHGACDFRGRAGSDPADQGSTVGDQSDGVAPLPRTRH